MIELWESFNKGREFFAGKKTYIMLIVTGVFGTLTLAGYPIPEWVWGIVTPLLGSAVKAAVDKWKNVDFPEVEKEE